jgi:RNA polymerase sigma-70 factor (ECF subfamily)
MTSAFEAFVRRYQDMVYATAARLLANPAEAEDVAQTVFLKAFQRFDQIGASDAAAGWLKTTARHECLNYLSRYRARWRFFSEIGPAGAAATNVADEIAAPPDDALAADLDRAALHERVEDALRSLPDHQRVPLVLFHFEETSYQEIAALLGVSIGKVKTDIHRGRERLRQLLASGNEPC